MITHMVLQGGKWLQLIDLAPSSQGWAVIVWNVQAEYGIGKYPDHYTGDTPEEAFDNALWLVENGDTPLTFGGAA